MERSHHAMTQVETALHGTVGLSLKDSTEKFWGASVPPGKQL